MSTSDHYTVLGVNPSATQEDIRRVCRKLVRKYHPDAHSDPSFPYTKFIEITAAYAILGDPGNRAAYDLQLLRTGLYPFSGNNDILSVNVLVHTAVALFPKIQEMDRNSISSGALNAYLLLLLSDNHLNLLRNEGRHELVTEVVSALLPVLQYLDHRSIPNISHRLEILVQGNDLDLLKISCATRKFLRDKTIERFKPLIVVLFTILICILIYLYGKAH